MKLAMLFVYLVAILAQTGIVEGNALSSDDRWHDTYYQYRIPLTVFSDKTGWQAVPITPADIVNRINAREELDYDPSWFAYNHVNVVERGPGGAAVEAGFYLVADERELIAPEAVAAAEDTLNVAVKPGATYLLRYTASGAGYSPTYSFKPVWPVLHTRSRYPYKLSYEPRILPLARTTREALIVPTTVKMPLGVKGRWVKGLEKISLRQARIVFMVHFDEPGARELLLYYQPLTGHYLTVPERRRETLPASWARLKNLGPAEKLLAETQYLLPGNDVMNVSFAETTVKLTPTMPPPAVQRQAVRISCAANEAQSFQLILQPRRNVELDTLAVSDLRAGSATIAAEQVQVRQIEYVPISKPSYLSPVRYTGLLADPLTPLQPQTLSALDGNAAYWFTVRVPAGTQAGLYCGEARVSFADAPALAIPLELEVYDFELPEFSPFRSSLGGAHLTKAVGDSKTIVDYHAVSSRQDTRRLARNYFDVMALNKFTPHSVVQFTPIGLEWTTPPQGVNVEGAENSFRLHDWDFTELNKDLAHYIDDLKVNAFTLLHTNPSRMTIFKHLPGAPLTESHRHPPHSSLDWQNWREMTEVGYDKREKDTYTEITRDQFDDLLLQFYRAFAENLNQHGWLDYAYVMVDETAYRGYKPFLHYLKLLKSDPLTARIKFVWTIQSPAAFNLKAESPEDGYAFNNLLDVYVPEVNENHNFWETHYFTDYDIPFTRDNLWTYVTYTTRVAIDTPGINNRAIALEVFNNGGGGFLIWGTFIWDSKSHQESNHDNPWEQPYTRWGNGAMAYFYPPVRNGVAQQPNFTVTPSLRVETYRESVDDYEYAWLLENLIAQARKQGHDVTSQQAVLDDIKRFFVSPVHWSQNDAWYLQLRDRLARAIVSLQN